VGSNVNQKDVLPASEIRSDRPIRTIVANNLIYNTAGDKIPVVAHDELDGIRFESNVINNQGVAFDSLNGIVSKAFELNKSNELIWTPEEGFPNIDIFSGFEFDHINKDLFGASRTTTNNVGAIVAQSNMNPLSFDKSKYGPDWFAIDKEIKEAKTHEVDSYNSLVEALSAAQDGDIIALTSDNMVILSSLKIAKKLTIQGNNQANNISLMYQGAGDTPLFEMNPKGQLTLKNVNIMGDGSQYAFASLDKNMSSLYNLTVEDCKVENFNYILKAFKHSFSENINLKNSSFNNCENGIELSEETEDKGEYNAENIVIDNCQFNNISQNVIDYYRGGYDESTVGGTLSITNSTFTNSGAKEKNGTLLNTYGIINVNIADNTFIDNKVKLVAELWGAKNNTHSGNKIANSGKIAVEENLKLKLLY
jgi:poly(beta-D-mannuronate) lyase